MDWFSKVDRLRHMAGSHPKKELELHPDAWQRFERAVDVVAKSPPQHRTRVGMKKKKRRKKKKDG
jgi:hypothetical protein